MKIPFDIKFRPQIESGEYKVETANGYPVRIYRWDFKDTEGTPIMGSYAFENGNGTEYCAGWTEKGRCNLSDIPDDYDLFIITPEPELTEFEQKVCEILYSDKPEYSASDDDSWKRASAELLELAEKTLSTKYKFFYWYQKYLKEKLTWEDVAILITIYEAELEAGKISRYEDNGTSSLKESSEMILKHFNELRKK